MHFVPVAKSGVLKENYDFDSNFSKVSIESKRIIIIMMTSTDNQFMSD